MYGEHQGLENVDAQQGRGLRGIRHMAAQAEEGGVYQLQHLGRHADIRRDDLPDFLNGSIG